MYAIDVPEGVQHFNISGKYLLIQDQKFSVWVYLFGDGKLVSAEIETDNGAIKMVVWARFVFVLNEFFGLEVKQFGESDDSESDENFILTYFHECEAKDLIYQDGCLFVLMNNMVRMFYFEDGEIKHSQFTVPVKSSISPRYVTQMQVIANKLFMASNDNDVYSIDYLNTDAKPVYRYKHSDIIEIFKSSDESLVSVGGGRIVVFDAVKNDVVLEKTTEDEIFDALVTKDALFLREESCKLNKFRLDDGSSTVKQYNLDDEEDATSHYLGAFAVYGSYVILMRASDEVVDFYEGDKLAFSLEPTKNDQNKKQKIDTEAS